METPLDLLQKRSVEDWLIGFDSQKFAALAQKRFEQLSHWQIPPKILLAERDPLPFLAGFIAACTAHATVFLANPHWGTTEWQQVLELVQPDLIWGEEGLGIRGQESGVRDQGSDNSEFKIQNLEFKAQNLETLISSSVSSLILIPTGGSSGRIRFAIHTWETLMASVKGFRQYFGVDQVNSFCVLPLYHVSGLMQFLRSFTSGGQLVILPFKAVEAGELGAIAPETFFLSLVPTQLQRLLTAPISSERSQENLLFLIPHSSSLIPWLSRFQTVLLGGAPAWPELLEAARRHQIQLALTYGMTETASQVVALKPDDFLKGHTACGQVLPHAEVMIGRSPQEALPIGQVGTVSIRADSRMLGYFPNSIDPKDEWVSFAQPNSHLKSFQTDDLGFLDAQGYLHIVGRQSDKIITGGENVFPAEVEAAIRATNLVMDVFVLGIHDDHWGQSVTAIYVPAKPNLSVATLKASLGTRLSKFKCPKYWIEVEQLPRNVQGKINRQRLKAIVASTMENQKIES